MSKFQQHHYEAIADILQRAKREAGWEPCFADGKPRYSDNSPVGRQIKGVEIVENFLAGYFNYDNGLFDRGRFERDCQPGANVRARS